MFSGSKRLLLLSLFFSSVTLGNVFQNAPRKIFLSIFGSRNASIEWRIKIHQAIAAHFPSKKQTILVKKMSAKAPRFVKRLTSFGWFNIIWINEDLLNNYEEHEKIFLAHHEVAHFKLNHQKNIFKMIAASCGLGALTFTVCSYLKTPWYIKTISPLLAIGLSLAPQILYTRHAYELDADKAATNALCRKKRIDIVRKYILHLLKKPTRANLWFPSTAKQVEKIAEIANDFNDTK